MSQDNKERTGMKNNQMMKISIVSVLSAALFVIEIYEMINDPGNLIAIGALGVFLLGSIFTDFLLIGKLIEQKAQEQQEAFDNVYRSEKAAYLLLRKYFDQMEQKMDSIGDNNTLPFKELISAQKALAKAQINRNKQNTNALLISNDRMMQRISTIQNEITKIKEESGARLGDQQFSLNEQDKEVLLEANRDVLHQQQEILNGLKEMEASLKNEFLESVNQLEALRSETSAISGSQMMQENVASELQFTEDTVSELQLPEEESADEMQIAEDPMPELQFEAEEPVPELQLTEQLMPNMQLSEEEPISELHLPEESMPELQMPNEELPADFKLSGEELLPEFQLPEENLASELDFSSDLQPLGDPLMPVSEDMEGDFQNTDLGIRQEELADAQLNQEEDALSDVRPISEEDGIADLPPMPEEDVLPDLQPILAEDELADPASISEENELADLAPISEENELADLAPISEENELADLALTSEDQMLTDFAPVSEENQMMEQQDNLPDLEQMEIETVEPVIEEDMLPDLQSIGEESVHYESDRQTAKQMSENSSESDLDKLLMQMSNQQSAVSEPVLMPIQKEPELAPILNEPELQPMLSKTAVDDTDQQPMIEEPDMQLIQEESELFQSISQQEIEKTDSMKLDIGIGTDSETNQSLETESAESEQESKKQEISGLSNESQEITPDRLAAMIANLGTSNIEMEPEPETIHEPVMAESLEPAIHSFEQNTTMAAPPAFEQTGMGASMNTAASQKDSELPSDQELDDILKAMDIDDILGDSVEDLDIDKILEVPVSAEGMQGSGENQVMNSEEIAALIANTDFLSEPEPVKKSGMSDLPDLSDPSHVMSSDEIAALLANM